MKKTPKRKNKPGAGRPRGSTKPPTERLNVRLPQGIVAALREKAEAAGMTITELMSSWIE